MFHETYFSVSMCILGIDLKTKIVPLGMGPRGPECSTTELYPLSLEMHLLWLGCCECLWSFCPMPHGTSPRLSTQEESAMVGRGVKNGRPHSQLRAF